MKLIINTSSLFSGGGVQVALSFIQECRRFIGNEFHVFLCASVEEQLNKEEYPENFKFYSIDRKKNILQNIFYLRNKLSSLEKQIKPDCVFSIFGPSYWSPRSPHLLGFATGHYIYPESSFFKRIPLKEKLLWGIKKKIHVFFYRRNSKYYHVETSDAKARLCKLLNCEEENVYIVSNTYNKYFDDYQDTDSVPALLPKKEEENFIRMLILSAFYQHKNLNILNDVIPLLRYRGVTNIQFITTLPKSILDGNEFSDEAKTMIFNYGFIPSKDCPQLYSECDFVFLPSLIECFSANYPEAMKMNKPIITSNLPFAHSICGDAALYIDPLDPEDIACKITELINDINLQKQLIENGQNRLRNFPSANERASKYLEICRNIAKTNKI